MIQTKITKLSDEVIGKIAAGEVVERPAAAIKELVENSLDAGATAVTIEIRDGGITYFRVTDNGSGIAQSEIRMAFERHATSKISTAGDLSSIGTLGFRGEALASIAAVGKVTCTTRTKADVSGIRVQNEGGKILSVEEAACPEGTTFVVKDLFFNTPVRLKFLKKPAAEAGFISDFVMRLILSRPDVSFRYISQGKTLYHSAGDGKLESAVFSIYGNELLHTMRKVDGCAGGVVVKGYVGIGESGRSNRNNQSFFINGRYMRSSLLSTAVEEACRERVMIGKYPVCVLHLTMPYDHVDVNVHPNKLEVRFQDEVSVSNAVRQIVHDALQDRDAFEMPVQMLLTPEPPAQRPAEVRNVLTAPMPVRQTSAAMKEPLPQKVPDIVIPKAPIPVNILSHQPASAPTVTQPHADPAPAVFHAPLPVSKKWLEGSEKDIPSEIPSVPPKESAVPDEVQKPAAAPLAGEQVASFLPDAPKPLKIFGALFNTYILIEYEDNLFLIDQHAVHERLLYERFMKAYDNSSAGQMLLVPLIVSVTRREQQILADNQEMLEKAGFIVQPFGEQEVAVRSIPMILGEPQAKTFLHDVLDAFENDRGSAGYERRRTQILQTACKHAVKGGEPLSEDVLRELAEKMIRDKVTPTCPHGRPLVVAISHTELDKKFKRIQN